MKSILVAAAAVVAVVSAQPATAADLPARMPVKAPAPVVEVWTWDGWYIGGNGGYSWGRSKTTADYFNNTTGAFIASSSSKFNLNGAIAGGQIGFNRQNGNWVWGLEGDIQWSGQKGDTSLPCIVVPATACNTSTAGPAFGVPPTASFEQKLAWFATLRGRLGMLLSPTWLAYATGGLAIGHIETEGVLTGSTGGGTFVSTPFSYDKTKLGWTVGGGLEGRLTGNWTGKLEYIYADYGTVSGNAVLLTSGPPLRAEFSSKVTDHVLRVGLNYKFGPSAVVARY
jgi:outer membrane immunogenic protein